VRLNRWVLLTALLVGVVGTGFLVRAVQQFVDANRSYTSFAVRYVPDSFTWLDAEFEQGVAQVTITNEADRLMTIEYLTLHLRFDGEFAGSWYQAWEPVELAPGQTITLSPTFTVTTNSIQAEGGQATLSLSGQVRVAYAGIERTLTRNLRGEIGAVAWEES
jgi:hypothetical protein